MRRAFFFCALILTAVQAVAQNAIVLKFRLIDNRIVVPITINGKGPYHCIIDTGANSVVSERTAAELGERFAMQEGDGGVGESRVRSGSVMLDSIRLGSVELKDISTRVLDMSDFPQVFGTARIDAILGTPLFDSYSITVDYDKRELTLTRDSAQVRGVVVPIGHSGIPTVSAELDGVTGHFGLDLGARSALLLYTPFIEKNGLRQKYRAAFDTITGWGIGGPVHSQIARAKALKIGGVEVHDPVIRLSTQKAGLTTSSHLDGLIGPDVFRQFRTAFDYRNNRVIFAKGPEFGKRDTYDRLGAWMGQNGDKFKILDVAPGSPAEKAGLQKGDLVLEIDGEPTSSLLLPDARERLRTLPVGTVVQMKVQRETKTLDIKAILRDLV